MALPSAGLLLYRQRAGELEVLLVHPGGPFWSKKDVGSWSVPKGEYEADENPLSAAEREFKEELGSPPPPGSRISLGELRQPSGKRVSLWAVEGDFNVEETHSNTFELEWPPKSGTMVEFPEVDRAAWMTLPLARSRILSGQRDFLDRLAGALDESNDAPERSRDDAS
jgi:predicted NUDIX family NTP pyrophosphohydrolase